MVVTGSLRGLREKLLATAGAQMAVNYANAELGGVGGHPIQLVTCFIASAAGCCLVAILSIARLILSPTCG